MLTHPTLDLLHDLGLHGMAKGFKELEQVTETRTLKHAEWLGLLLEHEVTLRRQKRFEARARTARLRHNASVEDVDYHAARGLDRAMFLKLASGDFIRERRNLLVTGPCGVGKSWLACALGHKACREDFSVLYHRMPRLFAALALARGDGRYAKLLRTLARVDLLILDDWGPEPLNAEQRRDLLEIVEDRYDARSIIITSQLPVERWYEIIGNPTLADAILDRIIHSAYRIELTGDSMRKLKTGQAELEAPLPAKEVPKSAGAPASTPAKPHRKCRRDQLTARPGGSTGTSRARRRVSRGARRVARGPLLLTTGTASCRA
jgi:DNA replication protein DnaC